MYSPDSVAKALYFVVYRWFPDFTADIITHSVAEGYALSGIGRFTVFSLFRAVAWTVVEASSRKFELVVEMFDFLC